MLLTDRFELLPEHFTLGLGGNGAQLAELVARSALRREVELPEDACCNHGNQYQEAQNDLDPGGPLLCSRVCLPDLVDALGVLSRRETRARILITFVRGTNHLGPLLSAKGWTVCK